jgi:hypothetical protein
VGAIFISYTGRDDVGAAWADRLVGWLKEWGYGFFRDSDAIKGINPGAEWRGALHQEVRLAQVLICLYSHEYDSSPWCVSELAIAMEKGKTVIPILLLEKPEDRLPAAADETPQEELKQKHDDKLRSFQLLLGDRQALEVPKASNPTPEQLEAVKNRLRASLEQELNWRALQDWDASQPPYPGLPAFTEKLAPVFFGRDRDIEAVCERASSLA